MVHTLLRLAVLVACVRCMLAQTEKNLSPCTIANPKDVEKAGPLNIGIAYWPGGTLADWGNSTGGLHPCYDAAGVLGPAGVAISAYQLEVDIMTVLRTSRKVESQLFDRALSNQVMSIVAFSGVYRSEPTYIWSNDGTITGGKGVVDNLALIADFDKGALKYLRWQDIGCKLCNGECLETGEDGKSTCASFKTTACACSNTDSATCSNPPGAVQSQCHTGIQVATSGTDKNSQVLKSGVQLQRLQDSALASLYDTYDSASNVAANVPGFLGGR